MVNKQELEAFYKKFWNEPQFNSQELNEDEHLRAEAISRLIDKYVPLSTGALQKMTILDLGCGRGWLTNILSHFGQVIGIDFLESAIAKARELFPHLDFRVGTASDLLLKGGPGQFQLVVSSEVIEHVPDTEKKNFMQSIHALLAPGGFTILTTPRGEVWGAWKRSHLEGQPIEAWVSEFDLRQLSRSIGFKIVDKNRIFVPSVVYNPMGRLLASRYARFLMSYFPCTITLAKLRYYCAIYQVILLQRV